MVKVPPRRALDTDESADRAHLAVYQRMSPAERVAVSMRMSEEARLIASAGIRARHAEYDEHAVQLALLRLTLGDDLFLRAFPGKPLLPP